MYESDLAAAAEDRSHFFWWLAEWFLGPPDQERLSSLTQDHLDDTPGDAMDLAWQTLARARPDPALVSVDELGAEFTRLISGIQEGMGPPPPFESVWREERLIGETTLAVVEAYISAGFAEIAPEVGPQDHIAAELRFLALLALRESEAWRGGDTEGAKKRLAQQRDFLIRHLSTWAPRWADKVEEEARLPLFSALAGLTKAGLEQARQELMAPIGP